MHLIRMTFAHAKPPPRPREPLKAEAQSSDEVGGLSLNASRPGGVLRSIMLAALVGLTGALVAADQASPAHAAT